jgi:hypothetical protein
MKPDDKFQRVFQVHLEHDRTVQTLKTNHLDQNVNEEVLALCRQLALKPKHSSTIRLTEIPYCKNNQNCQLVVCGYGNTPARALRASCENICLFCWNWALFHLISFVSDHDFVCEYNSSVSSSNRNPHHDHQEEFAEALSWLKETHHLHVKQYKLDCIDPAIYQTICVLLDYELKHKTFTMLLFAQD